MKMKIAKINRIWYQLSSTIITLSVIHLGRKPKQTIKYYHSLVFDFQAIQSSVSLWYPFLGNVYNSSYQRNISITIQIQLLYQLKDRKALHRQHHRNSAK